ncbi:MAG: metallophosphoesterase, partial [Planctomycetaceae bacterium]|nr:metallophosphoesterase [Planctomycetaceae bacterium]
MHDHNRLNRRDWNTLALAGAGSLLGGPFLHAAEPAVAEQPAEAAQQPAPLPFVDGSFTIVALPDTQVYCERFPQHFLNQTAWIAANKEKHDIQFVVHLGDITNRNTKPQWEVAQAALQKLDGVVPYSLALGNHDLGPGGNCTTRDTYLNDYVPLTVAQKSPALAGLMDETRLDNSYHVFA